MPNFTEADIRLTLKSSGDPNIQKLADEAQVVSGAWRILATTVDLLGEGEAIGGTSLSMFAVKKTLAITEVANSSANNQGIRIATFLAGIGIANAEIAIEGAKAMAKAGSPASFGTFIALKTAEKIVGAAGLADSNKCETAIAALTVTAGTSVFTCVATGGAMCIFGAAGFALEAYNTHRQCMLP